MRKTKDNNICAVAARAGVSHSTVSRVFHRDRRITQDTAEKVFLAAREIGYTPNKRGVPTIGVIIPIPNFDSYTSVAFAAVYREILKRRWYCELISSTDISMLGGRYISGAIEILASPDFISKWVENFIQPVITFCHPGKVMNNVYSVASDGPADMERIISYLTDYGHEKIGLLMGHSKQDDSESKNHRYSGFLNALAKRGVISPEQYVLFHDSGTLEERLYILLELGITAIIALPAELGAKLLTVIRRKGLRVPEDISLIAWEFPNVSEFQNPPLTALMPDLDQFAVAACNQLVNIWEKRKIVDIPSIPGTLIERQSVALMDKK